MCVLSPYAHIYDLSVSPIEVFPAFTPKTALPPSPLFLSHLPVSLVEEEVEEGVVITALVSPDSYIVREYTSQPPRSISEAVKHIRNLLRNLVSSPLVCASLFTVFLSPNSNFSMHTHASRKTQRAEHKSV